MQTLEDARSAIIKAWPKIKTECLSVLGSELHYQAMIYHALRAEAKVPLKQLGMNVQIYIEKPTADFFVTHEHTRNEEYEGCEPTPDVVLFRPEIKNDWRRRQHENSLRQSLAAIEVKVSERCDGRLRPGEIIKDLKKLDALREECRLIESDLLPVMLIIDSAPIESERMRTNSLDTVATTAQMFDIALLYISPKREINSLQ